MFKGQFGDYVQKYGNPTQAASAWFTGRPFSAATANATDSLGTTNNAYVSRFAQAYANGSPASAAIDAASPRVQTLDEVNAAGDRDIAAAEKAGNGTLPGEAPRSAYAPAGLAAGRAAPLTADSPVASSDANPNSGGGLLGLHFSDAARQGMLSAGLGMMGGSSMNPWINIGQGGQQGLAAYNNARKLQSEIGLQGAQAGKMNTEAGLLPMEKTSEAALRNAQAGLTGQQTANATLDNRMKERTVKMMLDALDKDAATGSQKSDAIAAATAPASPDATATAAPGTVGRNGPAGASPRLDPNADPAQILKRIQWEKWAKPEAAAADINLLHEMLSNGRSVDVNGNITNAPGAVAATSELEAGKVGASEAAKSKYDLVDVQPTPGGPTYKVPKSQLIGGPGAGSPPGSTLDAAADVNPNVAKQPGFNEEKQKAIASDESQMVQQYKARQLSRQRLQAITGLIQNYQPGAFAQQKAEFVAAARGLGLPIPDTTTANPAAFEQFTKNTTANIFNDVKDMGGRVLVSEIQGLAKANTNPELQPAANAALIGRALGVINYEDQHMKDYFAWKDKNPNTVDTSKFEIPWADKNPVSKFVNESNKSVAYSGQQIPASTNRTAGQTYMTPKGPMVWAGTGWRPPQGAAP